MLSIWRTTSSAKIFSRDTKSIWIITYENQSPVFNLYPEALTWLDFLFLLAFMYVSKSQKEL